VESLVVVIVSMGTVVTLVCTSEVITTSLDMDEEGPEFVNDAGPTPHTAAMVGETGGALLRPHFAGAAPQAALDAVRFVPQAVLAVVAWA
jgi:hypothetical protein